MGDSYRVPKRPVEVQLRTAHFGFEAATVYLADRAERHTGPQTACELFNGPKTFLPVSLGEAGVRFVALDQLMTVGLPPEPPEEGPAFHGTVLKVAVLLEDGNVLEGGFAYELPDASSRLQDYLNQPVRFAELHTADGLVLVNKRFISHVSIQS